MTKSEQPWVDTPPWNLLSADERRLGIQSLEPSLEVLDVCLAVIDGVAARLAGMGEPPLPASWKGEADIGFVVSACAAAIGRADELNAHAMQMVAEQRGPSGLSDEDAEVLVRYVLKQQMSGALHFATEHVGKRGNYTPEERLELLPLVRRHWASLNFFKKKDCLRIIAESDRGVAAEFFAELKGPSENDPDTLALVETQIARLEE